MAGKFVPFKKGDAPAKGKGEKGKPAKGKFPFPPAKKKC